MITNINEILIEWAYRTRDGLPNPKSMSHQIILEGILREFGWDIEQRGELLKNLQEAKAKPKKDQVELDDAGKAEVKKLRLKWLGKGYGTDATGVTHKNVDGKLVKVGEKPEDDKDGTDDDATSIAGDPKQFDRKSDANTQAATTDDGGGEEPAEEPVEEPAEEPAEEPTAEKSPLMDYEKIDRTDFAKETAQPHTGAKLTKSSAKKRGAGGKKGKGPDPDHPTQKEIHENLNDGKVDVLKKDEEERRHDRDYGNAGAGGPKASKGESMFCTVVDDYDEEQFYDPNTPEGKAHNKKKKEKEQEIEDRERKVANREERKAKKKELDKCKKDPKKDPAECEKLSKELDALREEAKKYKHLSPYPSSSEKEVLDALGLEPGSPEAREYLAKREVWAEEECKRLQDLPGKPNVYTKNAPNGFGGNAKVPDPPGDKEKTRRLDDDEPGSCNEDFMDWARTAYDGGMEVQRIMEENELFDETNDPVCVQSEKSTDDAVQVHLEDQLTKAEEALEECKKGGGNCEQEEDDVRHYRIELDNFSHNREYHDTYIFGKTKTPPSPARTMIISISNKKGSHMRDPQANTTPRARFEYMKEHFPDDVAQGVTDALDAGIVKVSGVQDDSRELAGKMGNPAGKPLAKRTEGDDDVLSEKRRASICEHGSKLSYGKQKGFNKWLKENGIDTSTPKGAADWKKACSGGNDAKMLKLMAEYNADSDFHKENGVPAYDPFTKVFIKIGEAVKHDNLTEWKQAHPDKSTGDYNKARKKYLEAKERGDTKEMDKLAAENGWPKSGTGGLTDEERCELMKLKEQESVNEAHQDVLDAIEDGDCPGSVKWRKEGKKKPKPKCDYYHPDLNPDGENGPHRQAYISSVMNALHFEKYIMMDDDASQRMIVQMGINGVTPDDFRNCLAEQSGYEGPPVDTPEGKKALVDYLKKNARLDKSQNPPAIVIGKGGKKLMEDTWRSAGTSQKVASGIGEDMRECLKKKVKTRRMGGDEEK